MAGEGGGRGWRQRRGRCHMTTTTKKKKKKKNRLAFKLRAVQKSDETVYEPMHVEAVQLREQREADNDGWTSWADEAEDYVPIGRQFGVLGVLSLAEVDDADGNDDGPALPSGPSTYATTTVMSSDRSSRVIHIL